MHDVLTHLHRKRRSGDILSGKENLRSDSIEQFQFIYELLQFSFKRGHLSCLDNCLYTRAKRMMENERPCDLSVLLDSAILAYTLLKVEFS